MVGGSFVKQTHGKLDFDVQNLHDGDVFLVMTGKKYAPPGDIYVPSYEFDIVLDGNPVGDISLRIGTNEAVYYGGHIGYGVDAAFRGRGLAVRACKLLTPLIRLHGMNKVYITNDKDNTASSRVCEKLGAALIRVAEIPSWHELYNEGRRWSNIFEWHP